MYLLIQIIPIIAIIIGLAYFGNKISSKLEISTRQKAPDSLREATESEKDFFVSTYQMVGRNVTTKRYRKELIEMSKNMKVAEGVLKSLNDNVPLGETTGGVSSANVEVDGTLYERIDISVSGKKSEIDNIIPETQMLVFCCPDNEGVYKIVTSVKKEEIDVFR